jgi:hypothetical protein
MRRHAEPTSEPVEPSRDARRAPAVPTVLPRLALVLLLALGQARAAPPPTEIGSFEWRGRTVAVFRIDEVVSNAPDRDAFALELAQRLSAYTGREGVEACARICRALDGANWGASLITIHSHAACPRTRVCPSGTEPTDIDIHSHLHVGRYRPSAVDRLFLSRSYGARDLVGTIPGRFSPHDFEGGAGYMVYERTLLFQDGEDNVRLVSRMPRAPSAHERTD